MGARRCSVWMMAAVAALMCSALGSTALAQPSRATEPVPRLRLPSVSSQIAPERVARLELAYEHEAHAFDWVRFLGAQRALLTGLLEVSCAGGSLLAATRDPQAGEIVLGIGCLVGATSLFVIAAKRLQPDREASLERLRRLRAASEGGIDASSFEAFERDLAARARAGRRSRRFGIALGFVGLAVTGVLAALSVRRVIDPTVGGTIGAGTALVGLVSLSALWVESPSEAAWRRYRAGR